MSTNCNQLVDIFERNFAKICKFIFEMRPKLVVFGNVLLDFTYSVEKYPQILSEYGFEPNGLGECSSEMISSAIANAETM